MTDLKNTDIIFVNEMCAEQNTEKPSLYQSKENAGDVEFVSESVSVPLKFSPLTLQQQKSLCLKLNIVNVVKEDNNPNEIVEMAEPCETKDIVVDGNCFFRAVAYAVSGSEREHRKVRRAVATHILQNEEKYVQYLRQGYSSVPEYITTSRMKFVGTWATEMEIQAASDLIGVDIFTYSQEKWVKYSSSNVSHNRHSCQQKGIYLKHVNSCHYEVVVCVKTKDASCASFCKSPFENSMFNASLKGSSYANKLNREKLQYASNNDVKERKKIQVNERYHIDETYREKVMTSSIEKYIRNEQHREKVKKI